MSALPSQTESRVTWIFDQSDTRFAPQCEGIVKLVSNYLLGVKGWTPKPREDRVKKLFASIFTIDAEMIF